MAGRKKTTATVDAEQSSAKVDDSATLNNEKAEVETEANDNASESQNEEVQSAEHLEADEMELYRSIIEDTIASDKTYEKRRVEGATRDERREVYKDDDNVVRIAGSKAKTENDKYREEVNILKSAATAVPPMTLTGVVDGFRKTSDNGSWIVELQLKDSEGRVPIIVPFNHFHVVDTKEYEDDTVIINDLTSRVGAEVQFIPYIVKEAKKKDEKTFAFASCVYAMAQEAYKNFIRTMPDGKPKYVNGMLLPATVVGVRRDRVKVNVMGAETTIDSPELSWTALNSIEKEFSIGDEFYVEVSDIREVEYKAGNKTYNIVKLKASKRKAEPNPAKKYIGDFQEGEICRGEIKAFTDNGLVFVRVKDKMDCLCHASSSGTNLRGDKVAVRIKEVNKENFTLYGTIHRG